MSKTVDKRVVQMEFDNKQFESNIGQSMSSLNNLNKQLKDLEGVKGLDELSKATEKLNFKDAEESVDGLGKKFSWLEEVAIGSLRRIGEHITDIGLKMAKSLTIDQITAGFGEYETKMTSVQTMMNSTGEDIEVVKDHLEQLNEYADKTIYSFSDMTSNIGKFTNAGVDLTTATEAIKGISNWAALAGANANEASRAMYNISQSMSGGYMQLIDWKSVKFANMATQTTLKEMAKTAEKMGTIVDVGNGLYRTTTTNNKGEISKEVNLQQLFNEGLQYQWLTTDVLMESMNHFSQDYGKTAEELAKLTEEERKVYEEGKKTYIANLEALGYRSDEIDEIIELGHKANKAATEVKTFSMLMDTLQEAVGSGWAMTFEYIFGDLNQAKELWTGISEELGGIIGKVSDFRNGILKEWGEAGGRDAIIEGLANLWRAVKEFVKPIGEAFAEVFTGDPTANLLELSFRFRDFAKSLSVSAKMTEGVKGAFKGLFSVIKAMGRGISIAWKIAQPILHLAGKVVETVVSITGVIGDLVSGITGVGNAMSGTGDATDTALTGFEKLCARIEALIEPIDRFKEHMMKIFDAYWLGREGNRIGNILNTLYETIKAITALIIGSFGAITGIDTSVFEAKIIDAMNRFRSRVIMAFNQIKYLIKTILNSIGEINIFQNIGKFLTDSNFRSEALSIGKNMVLGIHEGILTGLSTIIPRTVKEMFNTIIGKVKEVFGIASPSRVFQGLGGSMVSGLAVGIIMGLRPVLFPVLSELASFIVNEFKSGEAFSKIGSIGENIVAGIGQGMTNAISLLPNPIKEVVDKIIEKFCEFFGIESPSKVMAVMVGSMLIAGIGLGMMDSFELLQPAINTLKKVFGPIKNIIAPFTGGLNNVFDAVKALLNAAVELVKITSGIITDIIGPIIKQTATYIKGLSPDEMIHLLKSLIVIGTIIFTIVETLKGFKKATQVVEGFTKPIAAIGETLGSIGDLADAIRSDIKTRAVRALFRDLAIVIVAMMGAIYILGKGMNREELIQGAAAVTVLALVMGTIVIGMQLIAGASPYAATALEEINKFGKIFLGIGASLFLIATAIKKLGTANWEELNKAKLVLAGIAAFILAYTGIVLFITAYYGFFAVDRVWKTLLGAAGAIYLISAAFIKIGTMNQDAYGKAMGALISIELMVAAIIAITIHASKLNKGETSASLKGLGMALIGLGVAIMLIANATRHLTYLAENSPYWVVGLAAIVGIILSLARVIAVASKMNRAWKSLLSLAALFGAMGLVIKLVGEMDGDDIFAGIATLLVLEIFVAALMGVTGAINKHFAAEGTADIAKTLLGAAAAIAIMGLVVKLLDDIKDPGNAIKVLWHLSFMMMLLIAVAGAANRLAGTVSTTSSGSWKGLKKGNYERASEKSAGPGFKQLIGIALSLCLLAYAVAKLAEVGQTYNLNAAIGIMLGLSLIIGLLVGFMAIIGKTEGFKVSTIVSIGVVIAAITGALVLLSTFSDDWQGMLAGAIGIALILGAVGVMFKFLDKMPKLDIKQTIAIVEIVGVVGLIAAVLGYVAKNSEHMKAGPIIAFGASMLLIMVALATIFDMGSKLKIGAATAIVIASLSLIPAAIAMSLIAQYDWKNMTIGILGMSAALVILSLAFKVVEGIKFTDILKGILVIAVSAAALVGVAFSLSLVAKYDWQVILVALGGMVLALGLLGVIAYLLGEGAAASGIGVIIIIGLAAALFLASTAALVFATAIQTLLEAIKGFFTENTAQNFIDFWISLGNGIPEAVSAICIGIRNGIQTITRSTPQIQAALLAMIAVISASLAVLIKVVEANGVQLGYAAGKAVYNIKEAFLSGLRGQDFVTIGQNITEGLSKGISEGNKVNKGPAAAIASVAWSVVKAFCNPLGIHSPSWLFRLFGGFIVTGLVDGIFSGEGSAFNAGEMLGKATEGGFLEGAKGLLNGDIAKQLGDQLGLDLGDSFSLDMIKDLDLTNLDLSKFNFDGIDASSIEDFKKALEEAGVDASNLNTTLNDIQNKDGTEVEIKATLDSGDLKSETDKVLKGVYGNGVARWKAMYQDYLKQFNGDTGKALQMVVDIQNNINKNAGSSTVHNLNEMGSRIGLTAEEIKKAAETLSKSTEEAKKTIKYGSEEYYKQTAKNGTTINKKVNITRHGSNEYNDAHDGVTINNRKTILETEKQITVEQQKQTKEQYTRLLRSDQVISAEERNLAMLRIKYAEEQLNNGKITQSERDRLEVQKLTAQEVINTYNEQQKMRDVIAMSTDEIKKQEEAQKKVTDAAKETAKAVVYGSDEYYKQTGKNGGSINKKIASEIESQSVKAEPKVQVDPKIEVKDIDTTKIDKEVEDRINKRRQNFVKVKENIKVDVDTTDANKNLDNFDKKTQEIAEKVPKNLHKMEGSATKAFSEVSKPIVKQAEITGANAGVGLARGALSKKRESYQSGYALGMELVKGNRAALQVKSPSRVMQEIGVYAGEGLRNGIISCMAMIFNASEDLGNAAIDGLARDFDSIQYVLDNSNFDYSPSIVPVIDTSRIRAGVSSINNLMGQNRVADITADMNLSSQYNQSQIDILRQQMADVQGAIVGLGDAIMNQPAPEVTANVNLQGDARRFLEAMVDENTRYTKMHGRSALAY